MTNGLDSMLVVDDDESNRDMLSRRLTKKGFHVVVATGGRHALDLIRGGSFALILLDVMMPELDGLGVPKILARLTLRRISPSSW